MNNRQTDNGQKIVGCGDERTLRRAYRASPDDREIALRYSDLLVDNDKYDQALNVLADLALRCIRNADITNVAGLATVIGRIAKTPVADPRQRHNMAMLAVQAGLACESCGGIDAALQSYIAATEIDELVIEANNELAALRYRIKEYELSEHGYRQVLSVDPDNVAALTGLSVLLNITGRYEDGLNLLTPEKLQNNAPLTLLRARLLGNAGQIDQATTVLSGLLENSVADDQHRASALINLGKLNDKVGRYDEAMKNFIDGNALKSNTFDPIRHHDLIGAITETYSQSRVQSLPRSTYDGEIPVFIVGMPRSGTTLAEQLLAGSDAVAPGGERDDLIAAALQWGGIGTAAGQWPMTACDIGTEDLNRVASQYAAASRSDRGVMTDKMPPNFMFIGMIWQLFPNARVIHCVRNPLDTALSCFFQDFSSPLFDFCHNIGHLGAYYAGYRRLMDHWRDTLDLPIFDLLYEDLVSEPAAMGQRLFEFAGLEWRPEYLDVSAVDRVINTASHEQVRNWINPESVGRYKHYDAYLDQFRQAGFES